MLAQFLLIACVANSQPAECTPVEGISYESAEKCQAAATFLENYWQRQFGRDLPFPVHCEADGA